MRIKINKRSTDITLTNYSFEFCPAGVNDCGNLIYIRNHLAYKARNDLNIYKS